MRRTPQFQIRLELLPARTPCTVSVIEFADLPHAVLRRLDSRLLVVPLDENRIALGPEGRTYGVPVDPQEAFEIEGSCDEVP